MKKIFLTLSLLSVVSIAHANYFVHVPLEKSQGGTLPDGSIIFISDSWKPTVPYYSAWVPGESFNCFTYPPDPSYFDIGDFFIRSQHQYNSCYYYEVRTVQEREYNNYTKEYRNVGEPTEETGTVSKIRNDPPEPIEAYFCAYDTPSATEGGYYITSDSSGNKNAMWDGISYNLGTNYSFAWTYEGEQRYINSQFYQARYKTSSGGLDYYAVCILRPD